MQMCSLLLDPDLISLLLDPDLISLLELSAKQSTQYLLAILLIPFVLYPFHSLAQLMY